MTFNDEETWDGLEIKDNSFLYNTSRGIYSYYPDKDLSRACQRVLSPSFFDDDDTLSTSTSLHSDRFSVDDNDYSDNDDTTPALMNYSLKQQRNTFSRLNNSTNYTDIIKGYEGIGTITRLGQGHVQVDRGDWAQDLNLSTSLKLASIEQDKPLGNDKRTSATAATAVINNEDKDEGDPFADIDDDSFFTTSTQQKQIPFDAKRNAHAIPSHWKEEEEEEGFDDLEIPFRLTLKTNPPPPSTLHKRLEHLKEKDEDDFMDGLDFKDEGMFKVTASTSSNSISNSNKKGTTTLESKLPRPKRAPTLPSRKKASFENRLDRLTAPTYASRQRGTNLRPEPPIKTRPSKRPVNGPCLKSTPNFIRTSDGSSLMARPRMINYGNGSELDHLDDLAVWKRPSMARYNVKLVSVLKTKKPDTEKPWRCNMSKRKLTLIKPEEHKVTKEINDMRYDEREKKWHGNEQAARTFDGPPKRRPGLIKNMMRTTNAAKTMNPKSSAAIIVGDMAFDQQKMTWNRCNGKQEVDPLGHIDDLLCVEPVQEPAPPCRDTTVEFDLPLDMQHQMLDQEHEHCAFLDVWPLSDECAIIQSPLGHSVPQHAYILY